MKLTKADMQKLLIKYQNYEIIQDDPRATSLNGPLKKLAEALNKKSIVVILK